MRYFLTCLLAFFSGPAFALETISVNEEMRSKNLRELVCEDVYFGYYDYGKMFDGDHNGSEFRALCKQQSIIVTKKVLDKFPSGKTPAGFKNQITTQLFFNFIGEDEKCSGIATRRLPTSGFDISDSGEILTVAEKGNTWSVRITECD